MQDSLFLKPAEYTIDSSSLMEIFNDTPWTSKKEIPGLWERLLDLIETGIVISHAEVLAEIKKDGENGEELYGWAQEHKDIFKPHDEYNEGAVIRSMSQRYKAFVNQKIGDAHADPWLIAQAKIMGLTIITQETLSGSPLPQRARIPNVCGDSAFSVKCVNLWALTKERGWTFR